MAISDILDAADAEAPAEGEAAEAAEAAEAPAEGEAAEAPAEGEAAEAPAEGEAAEAPAEGEGDLSAELFSDAALKTPAGLTKARSELLTAKRKHDRQKAKDFLQLRARIDRQKRRDAEHARKVQEFEDRFTTQTRKLTGKPSEVLEALGELTGLDPIKALEAINLAAAGHKPPDAALTKLQSELAAVKAELAKKDEEKDRARSTADDQAFVERRTKELLAVAERYPYAKLYVSDFPAEAGKQLQAYKVEAYEAGKPITDDEAAEKLESYLAKISKLAAPGQVTGPGKAAKPVSKALTSAQVSEEGSTRELSPDEMVEADAENILAEFFR